VAAAGVTLLLWASAFVAIRHLGHDVPPGALSLARLLVGAIVLGAFVFRRPRRWPARRDWPLLLLCGIAWFGIYNITLNAAERRIDAGTSALVVQVGPIIVALLATVFLGERMTRWLLIGMAIGFVGVVVIARGSSSGHGDLVGVLLAIVAAVTYAIGVLAQKPLVGRLPGLEITFLACLIGAVTCLPWSGQLVDSVRDAPASSLLWTAYLGVFPTAIGFSTWAFALKHSDAGKLALTTFLVPFIATGLAWALLDEVPPGLAFVGGVLCIAGVLLTRKKPRPRM
jgi:drug/metabolite transporter (DMT)-like permease